MSLLPSLLMANHWDHLITLICCQKCTMDKKNRVFLLQDGRLQEGDKIVSINGRPAWCLTCGQVARCLRQNDTVLLGIHRAARYDRYDYMNSSLYCGSSRRSTYRDSVSSDSPRSVSYSTASTDSQVRHVHVIIIFIFLPSIVTMVQGSLNWKTIVVLE